MSGRAATTSWSVTNEVRRIPLRQLSWRVDAGGLEQVAVLRPDAGDPHEVDLVHPVADEVAADPGLFGDPRAVMRLGARCEQVLASS